MNFDTLTSIFETDSTFPKFHLNALYQLLMKGGPGTYQDITSWPQNLRDHLTQVSPFTSYLTSSLLQGKQDGAKALLTFKDQVSIETVLIPTKPDHYSVCVSCQSGCAMSCAFCATGTLGLTRSLTAEEITDQFLYWRQAYPDKPIKSVVFMGMGEPFTNEEVVFKAIAWLNTYYHLGFRHMTVSTCGLPVGILSLANQYPQVNLAISLHSADQSLREQLMPIAKTINLVALAQAITKYLSVTNRQITFEYLLIQDLNDTTVLLDKLINWLTQFPSHLIHVNLIGYNQTTAKFTRPSQNRIHYALDYLQAHRVSATIRKSYGEDIVGACGQLALKNSL